MGEGGRDTYLIYIREKNDVHTVTKHVVNNISVTLVYFQST